MNKIPCIGCEKIQICYLLTVVNKEDNPGQKVITHGLAKQCKDLKTYIVHPTIKGSSSNPRITMEVYVTERLNQVISFYKLNTTEVKK